MKALQLRAPGIDNLLLADVPVPTPGAGEVLVRMRAVSLNYRDLITIDGGYGSQQKQRDLILLSDGAGEVVEAGAAVTQWRAGDRVLSVAIPGWQAGTPTAAAFSRSLGGADDGVAAEYVVLPQDALARIPAHLDFVQAATLPVAGLTAWNAVIEAGRAMPGQWVLTQGSGGVSVFALQFAHLAGCQVISTSSSAAKLEKLRALGAAHLINYRERPQWGVEARQLSGGVDNVVEIGGAETLNQAMRAVRLGGTISMIGVVTGARAPLTLPPVVMQSMRLIGVTVGSQEQLQQMLRAIAFHRLAPVVDRVFAFDEFRQAIDHLRSGNHVGKVCIAIGS
jgi:NADPH:quinone reductase-like Zn-dependent oxidoreductase